MKFFTKDKWAKQTDNSKGAHRINFHLTRTGEEISDSLACLMINIILTCILLSVFILADYIGLSLSSFEYQILITAEIFILINYIIIMSSKAWHGSIRLFDLITKRHHIKKNKHRSKALTTFNRGIKLGWLIVQSASFLTVMVLFVMSVIRFW